MGGSVKAINIIDSILPDSMCTAHCAVQYIIIFIRIKTKHNKILIQFYLKNNLLNK